MVKSKNEIIIYAKKTNFFLNALDSLILFKYNKEILECIQMDTSFIATKFDSITNIFLANKEKGLSLSERGRIGREEKSKVINSVNLRNVKIYSGLIYKIKNKIHSLYDINGKFLALTIKEIKEIKKEYKKKFKILRDYLEKEDIRSNPMNLSLSNKNILLFVQFLLIPISIYIMILYYSFKYLEYYLFKNMNNKISKVSTIKNILQRIGIENKFIVFFELAINTILPLIIMIIMLIEFKNLYFRYGYFWLYLFYLLFAYLSFFIIIIRNKKIKITWNFIFKTKL